MQKLRDCRKEHDLTHMEFARTKEQLFDRWCSSKKVGSDHAKLRQLMLVEEFKRCINSGVKAFLDEKEVEISDLAARLADGYSFTHKASFVNKPFSRKPFNPQSKFTPQSRSFSPHSKPYSPQSRLKSNSSIPVIHLLQSLIFGENKGQVPLSQPICNYCKHTGHIISECVGLKKERKRKQESPKSSTGLNSLRLKRQSSIQDEIPISAETDSAMGI